MNVSHYASRLLRRSGAGRTIGSGLGGGPSPPGIDYSLSDGDIQKLLPGVKIIAYPDLANYSRIEDALDDQGRVVILFETESKTVGHWIALHATPDGGIEFFDSYGLRPDSQKRWLSKSKLVELNEDEPLLMDLLRDSEARGKPVTFNATHFQSDRDNVQTCGRHCVVRLMSKGSSLPNYTAWLKGEPGTPDDVVTRITNTHLGRTNADVSGGAKRKRTQAEIDDPVMGDAARISANRHIKNFRRYAQKFPGNDEGTKKMGRLLGYPQCCVDEFMNPRRSNRQALAAQDTGFIPCLAHAKEVLRGDIQLKDLIKSRHPHLPPFPVEDFAKAQELLTTHEGSGKKRRRRD